MANPAVLEKILSKLVRINAALGVTAKRSFAQDVEDLQTLIGQGTATDICADQVVIKAVVDATDGAA